MSLLAKAKGIALDYYQLEKDEVQAQRELAAKIEMERSAPLPTDDMETKPSPKLSEAHSFEEVPQSSDAQLEDPHDGWGASNIPHEGEEQHHEAPAHAEAAQGGYEYAHYDEYTGYTYDGHNQGEWAHSTEEPDQSVVVPTAQTHSSVEDASNIVDETSNGAEHTATSSTPAATESSSNVESESSSAEIVELKSKVMRLSKRVKDQQQKMKKLEQQAFLDGKKIHDLHETLANKEDAMAPTLSTLEATKKELATLKAEASEMCSAAVLNWRIRAEQAERSFDEAERLSKQRVKEMEHMKQDYEDQEQSMKKKMDTLQADFLETQKDLHIHKEEKRRLHKLEKELTQHLDEKKEDFVRLQGEVWKKNEDILTLQRQNQELSECGLQAKFQKKLDEAERTHKRALEVVTQKMLQEVDQMKQELEQAMAEKEQLARYGIQSSVVLYHTPT